MSMRQAVAFAALLLTLAAFPSRGQDSCNPEKADCTTDQALNFYRGANLVETEVVSTNKPTTAPDAFAGRVHNSYQDFLNLLSFAVNEVQESKDGQALIVRFNPIREGHHLFGVTLTVAKPSIADSVKNAIPQASRDATVALLEKQLTDTDDQTWSASYSYASTDCTDKDARCWGRQPKAYRDLLAHLLPQPATDATSAVHEVGDRGQELGELFDKEGEVGEMKLSEARDPDLALKKVKEIVAAEKASVAKSLTLLTSTHLDLLPALIDNQPQVTGSATFRQRGRLGGPDERAATIELHVGRHNINTLRSGCRRAAGLGECLQRRLNGLAANGLSTDKFVATFTYKKKSSFRLTDLGLDVPVAGFEAFKLPSASEYNLKVQGGRQLGTEMTGKPMRADLSFEGVRAEDNGVRTKNRWVGVFTLSVPVGDKITVPVSLTYANKAEFLGDPDERIGAHFGFSYRLPDLFKKLP